MKEYTTGEMLVELERDSGKKFLFKGAFYRTAQMEKGELIYRDERGNIAGGVSLGKKWVEVTPTLTFTELLDRISESDKGTKFTVLFDYMDEPSIRSILKRLSGSELKINTIKDGRDLSISSKRLDNTDLKEKITVEGIDLLSLMVVLSDHFDMPYALRILKASSFRIVEDR